MIEKTPLEAWIKGKIGKKGTEALTTEAVAAYHLEKLRETIDYAREKSTFYHRLLKGFSGNDIAYLGEFKRVPFTTQDHLRKEPLGFLCVPQGEIARVVTLITSGTTGEPKRLFFTREDIDLTIDFFCHGMSTLVKPGQKVLILLPGEKPDSVGDLLARGLRRINVKSVIHGPVSDIRAAINEIINRDIDCVVGIPTQVLALLRSREGAAIQKGQIKSVLLSTDYVPKAIHSELALRWGCGVYHHYGMTEMGLGGGVDCSAFAGYHLRETDLYFEIIDPKTGHALKHTGVGEVVFTTLTRKGMPLIRYRTGDIARFIPDPCPCGTVLRRMDHVQGRWSGKARLSHMNTLALPEMDEIVFSLPWIIDYCLELHNREGRDYLEVTVHGELIPKEWAREVLEALKGIPSIREGIDDGSLRIAPVQFAENIWFTTGVTKRTIIDHRLLKIVGQVERHDS